MYDQKTFSVALAKFTEKLPSPNESQTALDDLADAVAAILGLSSAGISLAADGRLYFATAVDKKITDIELWGERYQMGPAQSAFESGAAVSAGDLATFTERWPLFANSAGHIGVAAVCSIPIVLGGDSIGVLDLYSDVEREWLDSDIAAATALANTATRYLINSGVRDLQAKTAVDEQVGEPAI